MIEPSCDRGRLVDVDSLMEETDGLEIKKNIVCIQADFLMFDCSDFTLIDKTQPLCCWKSTKKNLL